MPGSKKAGRTAGGPFRMRVSDAFFLPLRGYTLRLKVVEGRPAMADLKAGHQLRLSGPDGEERVVRITDHSATSGRATQQRLDRTGELDIIISAEEATRDTIAVEIGWIASGPVSRTSG